MRIAVQEEPFDFGAEAAAFADGRHDMGAVVTFTGVVRDLASGDLEAMEIEHYPGMTEKALRKIGMPEDDVRRSPASQRTGADANAPHSSQQLALTSTPVWLRRLRRRWKSTKRTFQSGALTRSQAFWAMSLPGAAPMSSTSTA